MATKPIFAWSHSTLDMFENCRRKFWAVKIAKVCKDDNYNNMQGDAEHKAIEHAMKSGRPIGVVSVVTPQGYVSIDLSNLNPVLDILRAAPGEKFYEYEMTLDNDFVPCGWREWNRAWVRGAADLLRIHGTVATYVDWKSGKFRRSDEQIETMALLTFRHFPQVQDFHGALYYYRHNRMHQKTVYAGEQSQLWDNRIRRVKAIELAIQKQEFPPTQNPLCAYCPYAACPFNTNPDVKP
jgi:hypothetical protein